MKIQTLNEALTKLQQNPQSKLVVRGATTLLTVSAIIQLIKSSKHELLVRQKTEQILSGIPERNWKAEINQIYGYVKTNIRYMQDIDNVETVKTPRKMIEEIINRGQSFGDCDDHTLLLGALLVNAGYQIQISIIVSTWNTTNDYNHIYLLVNIPMTSQWLALDATAKSEPIGFEPAYRIRRLFSV